MSYVFEGQKVLAPIRDGWLLCVVACAMGNDARVVNQLHGIDRWYAVSELRECKHG